MHILYDHQVFSLQNTGGISRYHYELARNLQIPEGGRVELLAGGNASVFPLSQLTGSGTEVLSWHTRLSPGYQRFAMNEALVSLRALRTKVDIYHPTLNRIMPAVRSRRIVVTQHDCTHERFPHLFRNVEAFMRAKRRVLSRADAIICVSESSRQDLLHFYEVEEAKTHVVHHGFTPLASSSLKQSKPELPYLLYVGSRTEYKQFRLLLEAFALSGLARRYRLVAVGGGPSSPDEDAALVRMDLSKKVSLISHVSDSELAAWYRSASLFVYPSLYEGFGFPPLEAMSVGCPVLANCTSSLPEICGDAAFYFNIAEKGDGPAILAQALMTTLEDTYGLKQKREAGYAQVERYSWAETARKTLAIYAACLTPS